MPAKKSCNARDAEQLNRDLTAYSAAAGATLSRDADRAKKPNRALAVYSAAAAGAGLLGALDVNAAIVYTDVNWYIGSGNPGTASRRMINFDGDANSDVQLSNTFGATGSADAQNGAAIVKTGGNSFRNFAYGETIGAGATGWRTDGHHFFTTGGGSFSSGNTGYLGMRFQPGGAGPYNYAWIYIDQIDANGDWFHVAGYENQNNGNSIEAGEMPVPEPSTIALALLASGAAGVMASQIKEILKGRK